MEERVIVRGKMYIVPAQNIAALISWLEANAIDASQPRPMTESAQSGKTLLFEKKENR